MALLKRLHAWWKKDNTELLQEEATMSKQERVVAEEDYEAYKDDMQIRGRNIGRGGDADYERDSERSGW